MAANNGGPGWDMKLPFWGAVIALLAAVGSYYGQKEATSIALTEIKGGMLLLTSEVTGLKASVSRMEVGRVTQSDLTRDFAWRDMRVVELEKKVSDLELASRRKH